MKTLPAEGPRTERTSCAFFRTVRRTLISLGAKLRRAGFCRCGSWLISLGTDRCRAISATVARILISLGREIDRWVVRSIHPPMPNIGPPAVPARLSFRGGVLPRYRAWVTERKVAGPKPLASEVHPRSWRAISVSAAPWPEIAVHPRPRGRAPNGAGASAWAGPVHPRRVGAPAPRSG